MHFERLNGTLRRLFSRVRIDAGTVGGTSSYNGLELNQTWNTSGDPTVLRVSATNTASANGAKLLDFQLNNFSVLQLSKTGTLTFKGGGEYQTAHIRAGSNGYNSVTLGGSDGNYAVCAVSSSSGVCLGVNFPFGWMPTANNIYGAAPDLTLYRDAANTLAQRNGANAQESRLYGSYTSATAYQRISTKSLRQAVTAASGAAVTTTITIPKFTHLIGVTTRVTTELGVTNGTTGYTVGDGTDPDLWGAVTGVAGGTTSDYRDFTAVVALGPSASDRTITLTAVGGNFDGTGIIEVCAYYLAAEAD